MGQVNYLHWVLPAGCNACGWSGNDTELLWSPLTVIHEDEFSQTSEYHQCCPKCGSKDLTGECIPSMTMTISKGDKNKEAST